MRLRRLICRAIGHRFDKVVPAWGYPQGPCLLDWCTRCDVFEVRS